MADAPELTMTVIPRESLAELYRLVGTMATRFGQRSLGTCDGHLSWPSAGVYFFIDPEEPTEFDPAAGRIVRVGTHALKAGANTTLWGRLRQHKGHADGSGNHRGSVFRRHVGHALMGRDRASHPTWGVSSSASREVRDGERELETRVSDYLSRLLVTYVPIVDAAGPASLRGFVERNAIGVLTAEGGRWNGPSKAWLGQYSPNSAVRAGGLWNVRHVGEALDVDFIKTLERLVEGRR